PAAAGASKVPYWRFLPASLAGSLLWSAVYVSLGAFASASAVRLTQTLGHGAWIVFGLMAAFTIVAVRVRSKRAHRRLAERQEEKGELSPHHD
ncbi:DedA family protein, partial [Nonomuraea sp. NPDC049400]|uniref:DedA family protein n=1 Tax=Nonomuraea sp. NPDC049400 TaxID=3364352 RepID=UPI0037B619B3